MNEFTIFLSNVVLKKYNLSRALAKKNLLNNKKYFVNVSVKDEADDSDNLAALPDFKDEDLKPFGDACNDFPNGKFLRIFMNFIYTPASF